MFIEENIKTEIAKKYDVAVCGGGFAGISAALASARQGKKTVLFEKQYMLGGLGTAGIVTIYLPLCDGFGHQVSYGIAEELFRLSISMGYEDRYPENWLTENGSRTNMDKRFEVQYNPQIFAMLVEKLLLDNGVDIMYGTYAVGVSKKEDKIERLASPIFFKRCSLTQFILLSLRFFNIITRARQICKSIFRFCSVNSGKALELSPGL